MQETGEDEEQTPCRLFDSNERTAVWDDNEPMPKEIGTRISGNMGDQSQLGLAAGGRIEMISQLGQIPM